MKLLSVALALFHRPGKNGLEVWVQRREDDGPYHGLLEFPGGGIGPGEVPLVAAVREVEEEVGIKIDPSEGKFMGIYPNVGSTKTVLLYVFLFPDQRALQGKGKWLAIAKGDLSSPFSGIIPPPNHRIIDDLFRSLYDGP
jgi:8-oxo-dGTP diphosphatase